MGAPLKIDGLGKMGAAGTSRTEDRTKFLSFYADEAIVKGNTVALSLADTEPANGWGNHILIADSGNALNMHAIGIAVEAIASGAVGIVQVAGVCEVAMCSADTLADDGQHGMLVCQQNAPGELELYDTSAAPAAGGDTLPLGILIDFGTDATADSTVFLINPANL